MYHDKNTIYYLGPVTNRLPQGSALGPILCVLYINAKSMIFLFADETKKIWRIDYRANDTQLQKYWQPHIVV